MSKIKEVKKDESKTLVLGCLICALMGLLIAGMPLGFMAIYLGIIAFRKKLNALYLKVLAGLGIGIGVFDFLAVLLHVIVSTIK